MSRIATALLLAAIAGGAHAQVLASADNGQATTYTTITNQLYALDGTNTAISFRTTKVNEVVQFSFAAARCGVQQLAPQTVNQLNESAVQGFFYLDGNLVDTATGNADTLCYYNLFPVAQYMTQWGAGQMQQRIVVPTPGLHSMGVLVGVGFSMGDGTGIYPVFGETHAEVRK